MRIALIEMACNMALNLALVFGTRLGIVGLAISGAACAWINVGLLYAVLHRRGLFAIDAQLRRRLPRLLLASVAMAGGAAAAQALVEPHLDGGLLVRATGLALLIAPAALAYFALRLPVRRVPMVRAQAPAHPPPRLT